MQNDTRIHDVSHFTFFKYPRRLGDDRPSFLTHRKSARYFFLADSCFFLKYNFFRHLYTKDFLPTLPTRDKYRL
ncbi:hypothetical protein Hanom_Chr09g00842641 [Helianthus anomalus]